MIPMKYMRTQIQIYINQKYTKCVHEIDVCPNVYYQRHLRVIYVQICGLVCVYRHTPTHIIPLSHTRTHTLMSVRATVRASAVTGACIFIPLTPLHINIFTYVHTHTHTHTHTYTHAHIRTNKIMHARVVVHP